jgi:hypothetical protein
LSYCPFNLLYAASEQLFKILGLLPPEVCSDYICIIKKLVPVQTHDFRMTSGIFCMHSGNSCVSCRPSRCHCQLTRLFCFDFLRYFRDHLQVSKELQSVINTLLRGIPFITSGISNKFPRSSVHKPSRSSCLLTRLF